MEDTKCYCGHTTYCDCGPKQKTMTDWNDYPQEEKECTCKYCGEDSEKEFCNRERAKAYEADN